MTFAMAQPKSEQDDLIRRFMRSFEITRLQAGLVQSVFYTFCESSSASHGILSWTEEIANV